MELAQVNVVYQSKFYMFYYIPTMGYVTINRPGNCTVRTRSEFITNLLDF